MWVRTIAKLALRRWCGNQFQNMRRIYEIRHNYMMSSMFGDYAFVFSICCTPLVHTPLAAHLGFGLPTATATKTPPSPVLETDLATVRVWLGNYCALAYS